MSAPWARAVVAVVALILMHTRVSITPAWAVPLPVLVLAAGLAMSAGIAVLAVVLARGFKSSPQWRPVTTSGGGQR